MDDTTLQYLAHTYRKNEEEAFDYLGNILGTSWTKEKIKALAVKSSNGGPPADKFSIPLAYFIRPELAEMLKPTATIGGEKIDLNPDEEYKNLMDMDREAFMKMMRR